MAQRERLEVWEEICMWRNITLRYTHSDSSCICSYGYDDIKIKKKEGEGDK